MKLVPIIEDEDFGPYEEEEVICIDGRIPQDENGYFCNHIFDEEIILFPRRSKFF